jgi:hypothetical protein
MTQPTLFSAAEPTSESDRALEGALVRLRNGSADFAGDLQVAFAAQTGKQPLWTFDKVPLGRRRSAVGQGLNRGRDNFDPI